MVKYAILRDADHNLVSKVTNLKVLSTAGQVHWQQAFVISRKYELCGEQAQTTAHKCPSSDIGSSPGFALMFD